MGKEWQTEVWENLGWHSKVHLSDAVHVYIHTTQGSMRYNVMIGKGGCMIAMFTPAMSTWATDPIKAVKKAIEGYNKLYRDFVKEQDELLADGLTYLEEIA